MKETDLGSDCFIITSHHRLLSDTSNLIYDKSWRTDSGGHLWLSEDVVINGPIFKTLNSETGTRAALLSLKYWAASENPWDFVVFFFFIWQSMFTFIKNEICCTALEYCAYFSSTVSFLFLNISRYTSAAKLSEVVYDSSLVTFTYDEASGTVKTIHLTHNGFISSIRYRQTGTDSPVVTAMEKKRKKPNNQQPQLLNIYIISCEQIKTDRLKETCTFMNHSLRTSLSACTQIRHQTL